MWAPGQQVGEYELVAKLREGGMATLFLAKRRGVAGFSRHVAMKVVHPDLARDPQFVHMFLDEALLSSRIQHPNVVHVEELGQHEGMHYLTMEFVHGCSLAQLQRALLARRRRLVPAFATRIAIEVAEGMHAAHETADESGTPLNVVHRDVTPENILLAYAGHVKLIDFGIAKSYGRRHATQDGLLKGKFRYMAPEQALGRPVDRRVDIYQLGIVLWEMLTLRRLFDAEREIDVLAAVRKPRIVPPGTVVEGIPPALDAAVMAALEPQPKKRPRDSQSFARMLAKAVPAAHDVDSGSLRELLLAAMAEQRTRDLTTYPPGVFERLERLEKVAPNAPPHADDMSLVSLTIEHTEASAGDDADAVTRGAELKRRMRRAQPPVSAPSSSLADTLSSLIARRLSAAFWGSRTYWFGVGGALGLALLLALIALMFGPRGRPVPPPLPPLPSIERTTTAKLPADGAAPARREEPTR